MNEYLIIGIGVLIILLFLYAMVKISKSFRNKVYQLFLFAENNVIKGKKLDYVVNEIYNYLPTIMKILPKSTYKKIIQSMFNEIKDLLDDGKINKSNKKVSDK